MDDDCKKNVELLALRRLVQLGLIMAMNEWLLVL